jgi:hypothetical protein
LQDSVPVNSRPLSGTSDFVVHADFDPIAPVGFDRRTRELSVNDNTALVVAIGGKPLACDSEIVVSSNASVWNMGVRIVVKATPVAPRETRWERIRR